MSAYPTRPPPPPPVNTKVNESPNTVFVMQLRFDPSYMKWPAGMLKATVIILSLLSFICIVSSPFNSNGRGIYFYIVSGLSIIFSGTLLMCYLYHVVEKYHNIKWLRIETYGCAVLLLMNLIASTVAVGFGSPHYSAGGFFGYLTMVLYGIDAFLKARSMKAGELAQGQRVVSKLTHVTTPPALP